LGKPRSDTSCAGGVHLDPFGDGPARRAERNFVQALGLLGRIVAEDLNYFVNFNGGASALLNHSGSSAEIRLKLDAPPNMYEAEGCRVYHFHDTSLGAPVKQLVGELWEKNLIGGRPSREEATKHD
jgi:predicted ATPase